MSLLVLSAVDVDVLASSLSPDDLQLSMAKVFARLSAHSAEPPGRQDTSIYMPPRISIPTGNHTALFMPARIDSSGSTSDISGTSIKVVCVPNKSDPRGLPGTTLVLDETTGGIKAVVNARKLTALRNAAGSLLSTTLAGPSNPQTLVTFGAGQQIESHVDLHLRHFPSITQCTIINRSLNDRAVSLKERIRAKFPHVRMHLFASTSVSPPSKDSSAVNLGLSIESCVRAADVIVCATSSTGPLFPSGWVQNGTHIILIGSYKPTMREIDTPLLLRALPSSSNSDTPPALAPILLVDSREACLHEAGELIEAQIQPQQLKEIGELVPTTEGGHLLASSYRELISVERPRLIDIEPIGFDGPVTIFKSVGIGLQDVAIASVIVNKALSLGKGKIGTVINDYDV